MVNIYYDDGTVLWDYPLEVPTGSWTTSVKNLYECLCKAESEGNKKVETISYNVWFLTTPLVVYRKDIIYDANRLSL